MQKTSVGDLGFGVGSDDFPIVITTMPANARQHKIAFRGFVVSMVVVVIVTFTNVPLTPVDSFVPVTDVIICLAGLLTGAYLFAQYSLQPRIAILVLASGFSSSGLFAFLHSLAYPGAYGRGVLIGDELSSAAWLFFCWHTTFPISVMVYALTKDKGEGANGSVRSTRATIGIAVACVVAVTAGLTFGVTAGVAYLPSLHQTVLEQATISRGIQVFLLILNTAAIVILFLRRRTILDQWLIVTLFAWLPNFVGASLFIVYRFTLGWYMARVFGLLAGSSLLVVLLMETLLLYVRLANAVVLLRRTEQQQRVLVAQLEERETRLQEALAAGSVMAFDWDASTGLIRRSKNAAQLLGYDPQQAFDAKSFQARVHPDDLARLKALWSSLDRDNPTCSITFRFLRPDGREIWLQETSKAEFDAAGQFVRHKGLARDVTERVRAEQHQKNLMAELDHRVKNVLARVVAVADSTRQIGVSIDEFIRSFKGRIQSMAAAHALLSQTRWQGTDLAALVRNQLAPYATDVNVTIAGKDIVLGASATEAMATVVHELVTNAVKYGALSIPGGRVSVSWERKLNEKAATNLIFIWRELGGPPVASATRSGFGTSLIRGLIPHELGGSVDLVFTPNGVYCRIEIPSEHLISDRRPS